LLLSTSSATILCMLKIRLQRVGRKNDPRFRVIVTDSRRGPKSGKYIEMLGSYDPRENTSALKAERIKYWISQGAQVSGTVHNTLVKEGIIKGDKINVLPKKTPIVKENPNPPKEDGQEEEAKAVEGSSPDTSEEVSRDKKAEETATEMDHQRYSFYQLLLAVPYLLQLLFLSKTKLQIEELHQSLIHSFDLLSCWILNCPHSIRNKKNAQLCKKRGVSPLFFLPLARSSQAD